MTYSHPSRRLFLYTLGASILPSAMGDIGGQERESLRNIDDLLNAARERRRVPALAAAIMQGGRLLARGAVGIRKEGEKSQVAIDDHFHLGSCTKAMTATLAGMLVDGGRIDWTSSIADIFRDLGNNIHADVRGVTLEQLLQHRGGFFGTDAPRETVVADLIAMRSLTVGPRAARRTYLDRVLRGAPAHPPGTRFTYSNQGYIIAGAMLERAAETPWEDLLIQRIGRPLGMTSLGFGPMGRPRIVDQPRGHRVVGESVTPVEPGPAADNPPLLGPAGTAHCSIGDWVKFLDMHARGPSGGTTLLRAETFRRLHAPTMGQRYALGWGVSRRRWNDAPVIDHAGSNTMNYALATVAPSRSLAIAVATNIGGDRGSEACRQVTDSLIERFVASR